MMAQLQNFVEYQNSIPPTGGASLPTTNQPTEQPLPQREPIKHLLIGSPKAVTSTIHFLQVIGYANVGDWSPLLPTANPGEVMSILSRQILMQ